MTSIVFIIFNVLTTHSELIMPLKNTRLFHSFSSTSFRKYCTSITCVSFRISHKICWFVTL